MLVKRASAGTLKVNFETVAMESATKRHLFDRPGGPYDAEHSAVAAEIGKRGTSEPLRKQLDAARIELASSRDSLERSRDYAARMLIRMHKLELEIANLREDLAADHRPGDEPLIGSGRVVGLPAPERRRRPDGGRRRPGAR